MKLLDDPFIHRLLIMTSAEYIDAPLFTSATHPIRITYRNQALPLLLRADLRMGVPCVLAIAMVFAGFTKIVDSLP